MLLARAHFIARSDHQRTGVTPNGQTKLFGRGVGLLHALEFELKFLGRLTDMRIPGRGFLRHPDTAKILVVRTIAEPAAHLHECVVHH